MYVLYSKLTFQICKHVLVVMISISIDSEISSVSEVAKIFDGDSFYQVQITDQKNRFPKDSVISNASVIWVFEIQFFSHVPY